MLGLWRREVERRARELRRRVSRLPAWVERLPVYQAFEAALEEALKARRREEAEALLAKAEELAETLELIVEAQRLLAGSRQH